MPIFKYFVTIGTVLTGLLFAANAYLPPPPPAVQSSSFAGMPPAWKGPVMPQTTPEAPEPDMNSPAVLAAAPQSAAVPSTTAPAAAPIKLKKPKQAARPDQTWRNHYASGWSQPQGTWGHNNTSWGNNGLDNNRRWAQRNNPFGSWTR